MRATLTLIALAALAAPSGAQDQPAPLDSARMKGVLRLPQTVEEGRSAGIPSTTIWGVLDSLRQRRVPAQDAEQILRDEVDAVKAGAPRENFGATVNALLARGLRGQELAAAIHAEHARRGIGHGRGRHDAADAAAAPGRGGRTAPDTTKGKGRGRKP